MSDRARANVGGVETWAAGWLGGRDDIDGNEIPGSTSMCPSITGSDRGEGKWYWVTGKQALNQHTVLGRQHQFRSSDQFRRHSGDDRYTGSTLDWNCSNSLAVNLTSDNRYLLKAGGFPTGRGRDEFRYANWSGATRAPTAISIPPLASQMIAAAGSTIGEVELQMTAFHRAHDSGTIFTTRPSVVISLGAVVRHSGYFSE